MAAFCGANLRGSFGDCKPRALPRAVPCSAARLAFARCRAKSARPGISPLRTVKIGGSRRPPRSFRPQVLGLRPPPGSGLVQHRARAQAWNSARRPQPRRRERAQILNHNFYGKRLANRGLAEADSAWLQRFLSYSTLRLRMNRSICLENLRAYGQGSAAAVRYSLRLIRGGGVRPLSAKRRKPLPL